MLVCIVHFLKLQIGETPNKSRIYFALPPFTIDTFDPNRMELMICFPFSAFLTFQAAPDGSLGIPIDIPPEACRSASGFLSYCFDLHTTSTSHPHGVSPDTMGVVFLYEFRNCQGKTVTPCKLDRPCDDPFMLNEKEVTSADYIPAEDISAMLTSPGRVLVMGGIHPGGLTLPLTVVGHLDFYFSGSNQSTWTTPVSLHSVNMSTGRRKGSPAGETAFPFSRMSPTMSIVPDIDMEFLIGGISWAVRTSATSEELSSHLK